jgi:hypothetical protein
LGGGVVLVVTLLVMALVSPAFKARHHTRAAQTSMLFSDELYSDEPDTGQSTVSGCGTGV